MIDITKVHFDSQIVDAVSEINARLGEEAIFCGSLVLKIHGLIKRMVKDIDVITKSCMYGTSDAVDLLFRDTSGRFDIDGTEILCVHGGTKTGVSVDYFWMNSWSNKVVIETQKWYDGSTIQMQNVDGIIRAKRSYVNQDPNYRTEKHSMDLDMIMGNLAPVKCHECETEYLYARYETCPKCGVHWLDSKNE